MKTNAKPLRGRARHIVVMVLCFLVAFALGQALQAPAQLRTTFESPPPRETFLSGGERSERILRDISAILKQMDGRLARIEQAASDAAHALQALQDSQQVR